MLPSKTSRLKHFDLDTYIDLGVFGFVRDAQEIKLLLRFFSGAWVNFKEAPLLQDKRVCKIDELTLEVSATVRNSMRFRWWLFGLMFALLS